MQRTSRELLHVMAQHPAQQSCPPARPAGQELHGPPAGWCRGALRVHRAAKIADGRRVHRRQRVHRLEAPSQRAGHGALDLQRHVEPALRDAVARIFRPDIMSADDGTLRVADQQLAVIAERQPQAPRRAEDPHLAAGGHVAAQRNRPAGPRTRRRRRAPAPARRASAPPAARQQRQGGLAGLNHVELEADGARSRRPPAPPWRQRWRRHWATSGRDARQGCIPGCNQGESLRSMGSQPDQ
jgi:hypothetical protein